MRKPKNYAKALPIVRNLDKWFAVADLVIFLMPGHPHYAWKEDVELKRLGDPRHGIGDRTDRPANVLAGGFGE
jgi:hypothetical protein